LRRFPLVSLDPHGVQKLAHAPPGCHQSTNVMLLLVGIATTQRLPEDFQDFFARGLKQYFPQLSGELARSGGRYGTVFYNLD
jgi:hypothetical protein